MLHYWNLSPHRKTAIAIDTIINQKRFNDADDESEWCIVEVIVTFIGWLLQRRSCTVYTWLLARRGAQWLKLSSDSPILVCCGGH